MSTSPDKLTLVPGNLVRWTAAPGTGVGVVTVTAPNGRKIHVHLDTGEDQLFAWPNDALERVLFDAGDDVHLVADDEVGVVSAVSQLNGRTVYSVNLPGGMKKTVLEDGLRRAILTDPLELMRRGQLHSARSVNLRLAATRLLFAHQYDELSSLSNSRVEIKAHQVGVLHRVATSYPHRFLLADEVGLGKTVEAGLILKELKARGMAKRVLVLAPSGIVGQWQFELKTKFNEIFAQLNGQSVAYLEANNPGENVWALNPNVIASSSFASWTDRRVKEIALAEWDMVIVDEAHHARRTQGNLAGTRLFRLVQMLADPEYASSRAMLFLTATPMQLDPFELYSLIELLDPTLFPSHDDFELHRLELAGLNKTIDGVRRWPALRGTAKKEVESEIAEWLGEDADHVVKSLKGAAGREQLVDDLLRKHRLSEVLIRNRKAVVGGFMPRVAAVWEVDLSDAEWEAYHAVTQYARDGFERARIEQNNALGFLMVSFQKMTCSSSEALRKSLLRRIEKLDQRVEGATKLTAEQEEELDERQTAEAPDDLLATRFFEETDEEIAELRQLVQLLEAVPLDSKTKELLSRLEEIAATEEHPKVLIFTQFRDTQAYLAEHIGEPWTVHLFHGQLKPSEKDQAVARFREGDGPQILVSTEAGGEGRNFQFCHMLVNYDLPWNPMKVEQRIGRIDRIGQKHSVTIFNMSTTGTIEERVLEVLTRRIGLFEETVGGLDPILGDVERDLRRILSLAGERRAEALEEFEARLESRVAEARTVEHRLADLIMDTKSFRQDEVQHLLERKGTLSNEELKSFALGVLHELGVGVERHPSLDEVFSLRLRGRFADEFPMTVKDGDNRVVTFDPATALDHEEVEFLAFGNQLIDDVVAYVRRREYPGRASHRRIRSNDLAQRTGWFFTYALELEGLTPSKEVLPLFVDSDGTPDPAFAQDLLDRSARIKREEWSDPKALPLRDHGFEQAVAAADQAALSRLLERQSELAGVNRERIEAERAKLERFYEYKERAAADKLVAVRSVYDRLLISDDADDQKILPVWAKNLEDAERMVSNLADERDRRITELNGREQVGAQHELLTVSYVEVEPDLSDEVRATGLVLPGHLLERVISLYRPTSAEEVRALKPLVIERADKFSQLAGRGAFDPQPAVDLARRLTGAIDRADGLGQPQCGLLRAAVDYFLLVDDAEHDLTSPSGFDDDRQVAEAVLLAIGTQPRAVQRPVD
jgi:SNF2 family DNA or RNA helicase